MSCLLLIIGFLAPRMMIFWIWLLTDWFSKAYSTFIWPFLGFLLTPYTTLIYIAYMFSDGGILWVPVFLLTIFADISAIFSVRQDSSCT